MIKDKVLAFAAVGLFAAASAFAGDKECCAGHATGADMKAKCEATFAKLDLTAEQKTKMEKLAADCDKGGCNKESMARMEKAAQGVLSKEQFASWKAACSAKMSEKTQS